MDIGCACICDFDNEEADVYQSKIVTARKKYKCCECKEVNAIMPGQKYENVSRCWDGGWSHYKTCEICLRIRNDVCCNKWEFGQLRETIWYAYGIDYVTGKIRIDEDDDE